MGEFLSRLLEEFGGDKDKHQAAYTVRVKTGDCRNAGTDANIYIALHSKDDERTKNVKLTGSFWQDHFERGDFNTFKPKELADKGPVLKLEVWRDLSGFNDSWYVDVIEVERHSTTTKYIFPVNRWVVDKPRLQLVEWDSRLPQDDESRKEQRLAELEAMKKKYDFVWRFEGVMPQARDVPMEEMITYGYEWDLTKQSLALSLQGVITRVRATFWNSLDDMKSIYGGDLPPPTCLSRWRKDTTFGMQRLVGCNPTQIRLCKKIPLKLPVTDDLLKPFLEGMSIGKAIRKKRLFVIDYEIMKEMPLRQGGEAPAPIALFFVNKDKDLVPVAIQLFQEPNENNPIFVPSDPEYTWMLAKMWFNLADASYHQSICRMGMSHLLMETIAVATHRCLSPSHPLNRLLTPHFRFLLGINHVGYDTLFGEDGWIEETLLIGRKGMMELIRRVWKDWNISKDGHMVHDLEDRGVNDPEVLPNYHYRDDGTLIYEAIEEYVRTVVNGYYGHAKKIKADPEVLEWGRTLATEPSAASPHTCGIKGIPSDGKFRNGQQLTELLTNIIYICSAGHAAVTFTQYDEYGFVPSYPGCLRGTPPKDKGVRTENDVLETLPPKDWTIRAMVMSRILSRRDTKALGDFEVQYMYDPIGKKAIETLHEELKAVTAEIDKRNKDRVQPYLILHPSCIPNSIAI
ncbi:polyunsaturated fatty acid 5-lipoxygenase-like [Lytechinus variegatus]|uniref:polyunsaturated fatty acid 5-lipoxygenase-like n=1 Tax=Lytechinus variegatus TaxID=7654 RepID=UPI001BB2717C|nr:polyunsaturated fatty acid 5-lipoxygenase-like [Lytechinus variegatus]